MHLQNIVKVLISSSFLKYFCILINFFLYAATSASEEVGTAREPSPPPQDVDPNAAGPSHRSPTPPPNAASAEDGDDEDDDNDDNDDDNHND